MDEIEFTRTPITAASSWIPEAFNDFLEKLTSGSTNNEFVKNMRQNMGEKNTICFTSLMNS